MKKNKIVAVALAAIINMTPSIKITGEKEPIDYTFDPIITEYTDKAIAEYNRKEQERLAYEEWVRQEEYKRQNPEFTKYDLTEFELKAIARLCQQEQRSPKGSAAEASLMANLFELMGKSCGFKSLYSFVKNSGWFKDAETFMASVEDLDPDILDIAYQVLVLGKRTIPLYVDNHDCFSSIKYINTGDKECREDYIPGVTKIYNYDGADYTFYGFPDEISDPFGYNEVENVDKYGDACYDVERLLQKEFLK